MRGKNRDYRGEEGRGKYRDYRGEQKGGEGRIGTIEGGNRGRGKGGRGENGVVSATAIIFQKIVQLT